MNTIPATYVRKMLADLSSVSVKLDAMTQDDRVKYDLSSASLKLWWAHAKIAEAAIGPAQIESVP